MAVLLLLLSLLGKADLCLRFALLVRQRQAEQSLLIASCFPFIPRRDGVVLGIGTHSEPQFYPSTLARLLAVVLSPCRRAFM